MSEIAIIILIVGIVAFTIGFFLAKTSFSKVNTSLKEENLRLINELTNLKTEKEYYLVEFTKKQSENDSLIQQAETKKAEIAQIQEKFTAEFENLANKILDDKSSKFT
ncbi:MAG: DNA recombination protein RmuC, partial [Flavobacteriaceae bacterium]|nr:DNA recombination protein RmuC [Flavobacteriaceae bacterium]